MTEHAPRLSVRGISKTYGNTTVLHDVSLEIQPGEIHGLVGQNGSGKSTLIKIVTGYHAPDSGGQYELNGVTVRLPAQWRDVHHAGLAVVHQDTGLLDHLSVAENICVGGYPTTRTTRRIDRPEQDAIADRVLARLGVDLPPRRLVGQLTSAERAEVAIARALRDHHQHEGVLVLDEATRALAGADLDRVHALLRRLTSDGTSALLVSHNLPEVVALADTVTVLRNGRAVIAGADVGHLSEQRIASEMLGDDLVELDIQQQDSAPRVAVAQVNGLTGRDLVPVDFDLRAGEILGIIGLPGSGYEQIPYLLTGAQRATAGQLSISGKTLNLRRLSPARSIQAGVCLVPERRERDGLAFEQSVRDNMTLPVLSSRARPWHVGRRWQTQMSDQLISDLGVRPRRSDLLVRELSGGNQQKVLLGKWLGVAAKVLVLHEPTQAVDVGARADIYRTLRRATGSGVAVLIVSSDPAEIVDACDRALLYSAAEGLVEISTDSTDALLDHVYSQPA